MRTIVVDATKEHGGLWPRLMTCYVCRAVRLPFKGEKVIIEASNGDVLKVDARVEAVNKETREYSVRIW